MAWTMIKLIIFWNGTRKAISLVKLFICEHKQITICTQVRASYIVINLHRMLTYNVHRLC